MEQLSEKDVMDFINAVKNYSDYDFSEYSIKSFTRRLEKLTMDNNTDIEGLIRKISNNQVFLEKIIKDITVNTTELFRDPQIWQKINKDILHKYKNEDQINVWHAGSSTGQEVFSMLILLESAGLFEKTNVYATDLNTDVIDVAKSGKYKYREIDEYINNFNTAFEGSKTETPPLKKYLDISKKRSMIKVKSFLFNKPIFKKHDLVSLTNPFDVKYHIICCRNVLIYFNHELQNRIFENFHKSMHQGGTLIIGRHEGILGEIGSEFEKYGTIYIKK